MTNSNLYTIVYQKNNSVAKWLYRFFQKEPDWADLTSVNLKKFTIFLQENLSPNSVKTYLAELKAVVNLYKEEIDIPVKNIQSVTRTKGVKSTHCYLSIEELSKLEALEGLNKTQSKVRDMFLLQAWTGCRLSDAVLLTKDNIIDNVLSYTSQKTQVFASIPIKPIVKEILSKYDKLEIFDRVTYNRAVHQICRLAGIDKDITIWKAGKRITDYKYKLVTSHSARRSFATNLYEAGIPINKISYMMGHTDSAMTERYICSNTELNNELVEFFK
jgi:integrase